MFPLVSEARVGLLQREVELRSGVGIIRGAIGAVHEQLDALGIATGGQRADEEVLSARSILRKELSVLRKEVRTSLEESFLRGTLSSREVR